MAQNQPIARHAGKVTAVGHGQVAVQIESVSACASCQAHGRCGFAESKNKTVEVPTADWQQYAAGDEVQVQIDQEHGLLAVWIAYVLPALLLLGSIVGLSLAGWAEWAVIVFALGVLGIYIGLLYLMRERIGKKFTLGIEKSLPTQP